MTRNTRRNLLRALAFGPLLGAFPALALPRSASAPRFAAAWSQNERHYVGIVALGVDGRAHILASVEAPTRAHGITLDAAGRIIAVARRPGDWMLRWDATARGTPQWHWMEAGYTCNGHVLLSADGRRIYTTETDAETSAGLIGVYDARTFARLDAWPTHGLDPHQVVLDAESPDRLMVANGGILTLPETGRVKHQLDRMDSSLVRLDARGKLLGQWRLDDNRLSLRHIAWQRDGRRAAVALQAEHDDPTTRAAAPLLALFDGKRLTPFGAPVPLGGYSGDIAAEADGYAVSCTRANGVARFHADGSWRGFVKLSDACAFGATADGALWAAGQTQAVALADDGKPPRRIEIAGRQIDNHWQAL